MLKYDFSSLLYTEIGGGNEPEIMKSPPVQENGAIIISEHCTMT